MLCFLELQCRCGKAVSSSTKDGAGRAALTLSYVLLSRVEESDVGCSSPPVPRLGVNASGRKCGVSPFAATEMRRPVYCLGGE